MARFSEDERSSGGAPAAAAGDAAVPVAVQKTHRALLPLFAAIVITSYLVRESFRRGNARWLCVKELQPQLTTAHELCVRVRVRCVYVYAHECV